MTTIKIEVVHDAQGLALFLCGEPVPATGRSAPGRYTFHVALRLVQDLLDAAASAADAAAERGKAP